MRLAHNSATSDAGTPFPQPKSNLFDLGHLAGLKTAAQRTPD